MIYSCYGYGVVKNHWVIAISAFVVLLLATWTFFLGRCSWKLTEHGCSTANVKAVSGTMDSTSTTNVDTVLGSSNISDEIVWLSIEQIPYNATISYRLVGTIQSNKPAIVGHTLSGDSVAILGADPSSFDVAAISTATSTLYTDYARDASHVYIYGTTISGADVATFTPLPFQKSPSESPYSKDKNNVYYANLALLASSTIAARQIAIVGADPATFEALYDIPGEGGDDVYAKDKSHVYAADNIVAGADPATFINVGTYYVKDKNQVFGASVAGIDAPTFTEIGDGFYEDKNRVYCWAIAVFPNVTPATFSVLGNGYATDGANTYSSRTCTEVSSGTAP